jgi:hypothetical protein
MARSRLLAHSVLLTGFVFAACVGSNAATRLDDAGGKPVEGESGAQSGMDGASDASARPDAIGTGSGGGCIPGSTGGSGCTPPPQPCSDGGLNTIGSYARSVCNNIVSSSSGTGSSSGSGGAYFGASSGVTGQLCVQAYTSGAVGSFAVDSSNLYVSPPPSTPPAGPGGSFCTGGIWSLAKGNRNGSTLLATTEQGSSSVATDGTNVYWAESDSIRAVSVTGGLSFTIASQQSGPRSLVLDATNAYWVNLVANPSGAGSASLMKASKSGGAPTQLASNLTPFAEIAVDAQSVYWVDGATVKRVPSGGGNESVVATTETSVFPSPVAVDATNLYWGQTFFVAGTVAHTGVVLKVPLAGGPVVTLASIPDSAAALAVDGSQLYVAGGEQVFRVPTSGGAATTIGLTYSVELPIAIDTSNVYWLSTEDGVVGVTK